MDLPAVSISPPVLFFVLGMVATLVRSNLRVPHAVTKLMSLYLLWAIGFTGGVKIAQSGMGRDAMVAVAIGMGLSAVLPLAVFALLRRRIGIHDAAASAAAFGSVSAVTFLTAASMLDALGIGYGGHMVAVMALMESPAIVVSIILLRRAQQASPAAADADAPRATWGTLLHEAFLNGPVLLLLGSLVIGLITRERGFEAFKPLCKDLFNGVLVFFLLDLGLLAARRLRGFLARGWSLVVFGLVFPPVAGSIALVLAWLGGLGVGDTTLLATLAASASYIAVPAAARIAIPKADPSVYIGLALAVTFPFNVIVGIPLYLAGAKALCRG
ncbi:MAG: sodium-dependent bicarbonate transport family permease [Planctomycetaceae bacterium]|nr:sodium-dependent bicarbonate transport family permease [Planctomycetaceae bacterium]